MWLALNKECASVSDHCFPSLVLVLLEIRLERKPENRRKSALTSKEKGLWHEVKVRVESPEKSREALTLTLDCEAR